MFRLDLHKPGGSGELVLVYVFGFNAGYFSLIKARDE
jgi:hypothetical protein